VSKPRYRHRHQQERKRWAPVVAAGEAYCAQPVCVMATRWIPPGTAWALGHDDTGQVWIGPVHQRCNARDGAARGNRMRSRKPRLVKRAANRWVI
jgi:hypothetical protein